MDFPGFRSINNSQIFDKYLDIWFYLDYFYTANSD